MISNLKRPRSAELAGVFLSLLARYAHNKPDKTQIDRQIEVAANLAGTNRDTAKRIVERFEKLPINVRTKMLPSFENATRMDIPFDRIKTILKNELLRTRVSDDDVVPPPTTGPARPYTYFLEYKGLHCAAESDWDRWSNSDEVYIITSVVAINPFVTNPETMVKTEKHPLTQSHYTDVDDRESRDGPVAICWSGPASDLSLVVTVMERDEGDPNAYKDEVNMIVTAAAATLIYFGVPPTLTGALAPLVSWALKGLLGSDDDLIADVYRTLTWNDVINYVNTKLKKDDKMHSIAHHFYTTHSGGGAEYRVLFSCRGVRT